MAVMVELEKVKDIVKKHGKYIEGLFTELDKLAYGKLYTCWYCGENIYAGDGAWYHVNGGVKECIKSSGAWVPEYRATPKPKDMAGSPSPGDDPRVNELMKRKVV